MASQLLTMIFDLVELARDFERECDGNVHEALNIAREKYLAKSDEVQKALATLTRQRDTLFTELETFVSAWDTGAIALWKEDDIQPIRAALAAVRGEYG